jgi:hypothetical protein
MNWLKKLISNDPSVSSGRVIAIACTITSIGIAVGGVIAVLKYQLKPDYLTGIAGIVGVFIINVVGQYIRDFATKSPNNINEEVKDNATKS